jgi:hypothetical protein
MNNLEKELYKTLQVYRKMKVRFSQHLKDNDTLLKQVTTHVQSDAMIMNKDVERLDKEIVRIEELLNK